MPQPKNRSTEGSILRKDEGHCLSGYIINLCRYRREILYTYKSCFINSYGELAVTYAKGTEGTEGIVVFLRKYSEKIIRFQVPEAWFGIRLQTGRNRHPSPPPPSNKKICRNFVLWWIPRKELMWLRPIRILNTADVHYERVLLKSMFIPRVQLTLWLGDLPGCLTSGEDSRFNLKTHRRVSNDS